MAPGVLALSPTLGYSGGREACSSEGFREIFCSISPRHTVKEANSDLTQVVTLYLGEAASKFPINTS